MELYFHYFCNKLFTIIDTDSVLHKAFLKGHGHVKTLNLSVYAISSVYFDSGFYKPNSVYSSKFKLEAIEYARLIGQRATSRLLEVSQRRIFDWISCWQKFIEEVDPSNSTKISDFGSVLQFATAIATIPDSDQRISTSDAFQKPETISSRFKSSTRVKKTPYTFIPPSETENDESESSQNAAAPNGATELEDMDTVQSNEKTNIKASISTRSLKQILDVGVESEVWGWVQSLLPSKATSSQIRDKARELYRARGYTQIQCSYGWYRRWAERYHQSVDPHGDTDPKILAWLLQQYDNNRVVSYADLQKCAQSAIAKYKPNFKASIGWSVRFFKRHHIFVNWDGYYDELLPPILQDKVEAYIERLRDNVTPGFPLNRIGCMDEISLSFSSRCTGNNGATQLLSLFPPAISANVEVCEIKMPRSKKITVKNCDATVILALLADGTLLPPLVILKNDKKNTVNRAFKKTDNPVVVFYNETTEPSPASLNKWMDTIWLQNVPYGPPSLLVWDSYDVHSLMAGHFESVGVKTEMFPDGCSCKLQPLGVFAKVAIVKSIEEHWTQYLQQNSSGPGIKLPSADEMVNWINVSYAHVKTNGYNRLRESFQTVGLIEETELTG